MSLYKYFKPGNPAVKPRKNTDLGAVSVLSSPSGPLSLQMPSSHIEAANNLVQYKGNVPQVKARSLQISLF